MKTAAAAAVGMLASPARTGIGAAAQLPADLTMLTLVDVSELIRHRKVSPVEVTTACLQRIERLNPSLNAFITVTRDTALARARLAEEDIQRGRWRGPLHGIPIALKDLFDTVGVKTTAASAVFEHRVPERDAEVVRRLDAAGAVILGKTNMVEFAYGTNAAISAYGPTRNPWNLERNPGGSSSGSAAAVAANLCYAALGSDTAGSVRVPAAFCGIVGLKPTYGLVSTRGAVPLSWTCDHVGPMARTVDDATVVLQAIAGYDAGDTNSIRATIPDYRAALHHPTSTFRLGVVRGFFFDDLDPEFQLAIDDALVALRGITAEVRDTALPSAAAQESVRAIVRGAEAFQYHAEWVKAAPELYLAETLVKVRAGGEVTASDYIKARRDLAESRRAIEKTFESVDLLVTPTTAGPPHTLAELNADMQTSMRLGTAYARNTSPFNVYGIPSISVPCGFTKSGLPIGLQISGPPLADAKVLQLAAAYEHMSVDRRRTPTLG
jgi:aspartyl-tRNA(Asn)/glutamyl-tRNA(Gln) amidotransferase subunit A